MNRPSWDSGSNSTDHAVEQPPGADRPQGERVGWQVGDVRLSADDEGSPSFCCSRPRGRHRSEDVRCGAMSPTLMLRLPKGSV